MSNANPNSQLTSNRDSLNLYIQQLHQRLRLGVSLRGVAILFATALITTIFLVLILNRFAFPVRGLTGARSLLLIVIACAGGLALALPLRRRCTSSVTVKVPLLDISSLAVTFLREPCRSRSLVSAGRSTSNRRSLRPGVSSTACEDDPLLADRHARTT